jgi:hypothetical protein
MNEEETTSESKPRLREINFPEVSLGALYQIYRTGNTSGWWEERIGEAQGTITVESDVALHLLVAPTVDFNALRALQPGDLQSIDFRQCAVDDHSLESIAHLTGSALSVTARA